MRRSVSLVVMLWLAGCGADGLDPGGAGGGGPAAGGGGGSSIDAGACTDTWANFGDSFFPLNCGGCHGSYDNHGGVQAGASGLAAVIASGSMPQGGAISSTDRARAVHYLRCGAP